MSRKPHYGDNLWISRPQPNSRRLDRDFVISFPAKGTQERQVYSVMRGTLIPPPLLSTLHLTFSGMYIPFNIQVNDHCLMLLRAAGDETKRIPILHFFGPLLEVLHAGSNAILAIKDGEELELFSS